MIVTDTDKAYIAGLIDGEGSICILRSNSKKEGTHSYGAVVQIRMTHKDPVFFVSQRYGGRIKNHNITSTGKIIYDLKIYSRKALSLLYDIEQFLQCKRRQVGVVKALYRIDGTWGKSDTDKEKVETKRKTLMRMCQRLNRESHGIELGGSYDC